MINAYLQRLKDNVVYDNSVIIIMADHGYIEHDTDLILTQEDPIILDRYNSLLLIKGFNEKHELLKSDLPLFHFDLIDVYSDLLSGKKSTDLFSDIAVPRIRKLICYTWEQDNHIVEYETDGTARDWESFRETGNVYDK
jgi:arylsulfatase A-like enzyme